MCKPGTNIKFCTCGTNDKKNLSIAPHEKNDEFRIGQLVPNANTSYYWYLLTYVGSKKSKVIGSMQSPDDIIGSNLTSEYVIEQLNYFDCFDFDYTPREGDILIIRPNTSNYLFEYLSLKYSQGKWSYGYYNNFTCITKTKSSGKVQFVEGEPIQHQTEKKSFYFKFLKFFHLTKK